MKKTLLLSAMCGFATLSFAQVEVRQSENVDIPEVNVVEDAVDMIEAAPVETTAEIYIKRPGGVFHPGNQQKSSARLTVPYVKAPAYVPLTWSLGTDHFSDKDETAGTFTLAVPTCYTWEDAAEDWLTSDGKDITCMFYPMGSKFYSAPYATCKNTSGEYTYTMFPDYVSGSTVNPAHIYAGGSLSLSSSSGYQMAANYNAYWAGSNSYATKYYGFNTATSDAGWASRGYTDAHVVGLSEFFDKPASPYVLMSASWQLTLPAGGSAGPLKLTIRKVGDNGIGDVLAVAYADEPVYVNGTTVVYNFTELLDNNEQKMDYLIVEDEIMVEIGLLDDDTETNLIGSYLTSPTYNGEGHAYTHITYTKDGATKDTWANSNFSWTSSAGVKTYQQSFRCGLEIKYYYAKVIDPETGKATEKNELEIPVAGNAETPAEFLVDAYLNYGGWQIFTEDGIEFTRDGYDWTCTKYDWLKVKTVPNNDSEDKWNGTITMSISADANSGEEETANFYVYCRGFKEPFTVKREGSATGIANVALQQAAKAGAYNVAGQKVGDNFKGIVILDGKKFMK